MFRRDEVTNRVRVVEILPGEPAYITVTQYVVRPDNKARTMTQKAPIFDSCVAEKMLTEVRAGDEIEATFVTEWSKEGYKTYISAFSVIASNERPVHAVPA